MGWNSKTRTTFCGPESHDSWEGPRGPRYRSGILKGFSHLTLRLWNLVKIKTERIKFMHRKSQHWEPKSHYDKMCLSVVLANCIIEMERKFARRARCQKKLVRNTVSCSESPANSVVPRPLVRTWKVRDYPRIYTVFSFFEHYWVGKNVDTRMKCNAEFYVRLCLSKYLVFTDRTLWDRNHGDRE